MPTPWIVTTTTTFKWTSIQQPLWINWGNVTLVIIAQCCFNATKIEFFFQFTFALARFFSSWIFQNFQGVFISIKIDPKFLWGLIYELKHIQEPPPLSCQQSQTSSIDNAIFLYWCHVCFRSTQNSNGHILIWT